VLLVAGGMAVGLSGKEGSKRVPRKITQSRIEVAREGGGGRKNRYSMTAGTDLFPGAFALRIPARGIWYSGSGTWNRWIWRAGSAFIRSREDLPAKRSDHL